MALRLLSRRRRLYGVHFLDVVVADAGYAKGPFLKAVTALGWALVVVLKQGDYDVYQEAWALTQGQPTHQFRQEEREVRLWEVRNLTFSKTYGRAVRGVRAEEKWTQFKVVGGKKIPVPKQSDWLWGVTEDLGGYGGRTIGNLGHGWWRIENYAFNVLAQHWHLRHCAHHDPTSILACLLITLLPSTCFMPLFCSRANSIGRARSPCKNCACNSTGPLNTARSCSCSAGERKDRLSAVCSLILQNWPADLHTRSVYWWNGRGPLDRLEGTSRPSFPSASAAPIMVETSIRNFCRGGCGVAVRGGLQYARPHDGLHGQAGLAAELKVHGAAKT